MSHLSIDVEIVADPEDEGATALELVSRELIDYTRPFIEKLFRSSRIVSEGLPVSPRSSVAAGQRLAVTFPEEAGRALRPVALDLAVLLCDASLLAIDKPAGLTVLPGLGFEETSAYQAAWALLVGEGLRPRIVHRLDKGTSGVLVFACTAEAQARLVRQFEERRVEKTYRALVRGVVKDDEGAIEAPLAAERPGAQRQRVSGAGKPALTRYKVMARFRHATDLAVWPRTGRTHQIRVHLATIGHPLLIDPLYGDARPFLLSSFKRHYKTGSGQEERPLLDRTPLHASRLTCSHPATGAPLVLEAPLAHDYAVTLEKLSRWG